MSEQEQDNAGGKQEGSDPESGEEQKPKQAEEESSGLWDTKQHSDAPGPFGTGDEQTVEEAAGNPEAEEAEDE